MIIEVKTWKNRASSHLIRCGMINPKPPRTDAGAGHVDLQGVSGAQQSLFDGSDFNVSHTKIQRVLEKQAHALPPLKKTIAPAKADDTLETDEVLIFCKLKINKLRAWIVQYRRICQVLSFFNGDSASMTSYKPLWRKIPVQYLKLMSFSDFWKPHSCIPKETGETAHIEQLSSTIRQRLSWFVRKTLSLSKKEYMLNLHVKLWVWHYNLFDAPRIATKATANKR